MAKSVLSGIILPAGVAAAGGAPLQFTAGVPLTTPVAGVSSYDGSFFFLTPNTTSGRGQIPVNHVFRLTSAGSAIGPTIADFFGASSSINLVASAAYEFEALLFFTKQTAGTLTITITASSAPSIVSATYISGPITGAVGAGITAYTAANSSATVAFAASGSLTTGLAHSFWVRGIVGTNAATTFKFQVTCSAGTVTPQPGSFYKVNRIATSTGAFS
jgi:hypothetical protein